MKIARYFMELPIFRDFFGLFSQVMDYRGSMSRQDFWRAMAGYVLVYVFFALISIGMLNYVIPALPIRNGFVLAWFFCVSADGFPCYQFLAGISCTGAALAGRGVLALVAPVDNYPLYWLVYFAYFIGLSDTFRPCC